MHRGVVQLCVGRAQELSQAEGDVAGQRWLLGVGRGVRGVVVRGAVGGSGPPLVVVVEIAERRRLVAVAELLLEHEAARLGARAGVGVAGVPGSAALVLAARVLERTVPPGPLTLQSPLSFVSAFQLLGRLLQGVLSKEIPHERLIAVSLREVACHQLVIVLIVHLGDDFRELTP